MRAAGKVFLTALALAAGCGPDDNGDTGGIDIRVAAAKFRLGGIGSNIPPGIVLTDASAGTVRLTRDGPFWFDERLPEGAEYSVSLSGDIPLGRFCTLTNGSGTMPAADLAEIEVACRATASAGGASP